MWELITTNERKSLAVFIIMGICLAVMGYVAGMVYSSHGARIGMIGGFIIWGILSFVSYSCGDSLILSAVNAREVTHDVHPQLFNIVDEMTIAAGLPSVPKIYIIEDTGLNAINRDTMMITFASVMLGCIFLTGRTIRNQMFRASWWIKDRDSEVDKHSVIMVLVTIAVALVVPIATKLLFLALSRRREYLADASAVRLTRYPEGLASALEKIAYHSTYSPWISAFIQPMCIALPDTDQFNILSTHPPIDERIKILRGMTLSASFVDYQMVYRRVKQVGEQIIPTSGLNLAGHIPLREVRRETAAVSQKQRNSVDAEKGAVEMGCAFGCWKSH